MGLRFFDGAVKFDVGGCVGECTPFTLKLFRGEKKANEMEKISPHGLVKQASPSLVQLKNQVKSQEKEILVIVVLFEDRHAINHVLQTKE